MEEETVRFQNDRSERIRILHERQDREIQQFDVETTQLGLNAVQIAEATQDLGPDDDLGSVRGSVLSLTPSTSSNSFSHL